MAVTDLANIAAATSAGYSETVTDRGASWTAAVRFEVTLAKQMSGEPTAAGFEMRAFGQGSTQANAETQALASLNAQRKHRYGGAPGRPDGAANSPGSRGGAHTVDAT